MRVKLTNKHRRVFIVMYYNSHSNLSDGPIFAEDVVHFLSCNLVGQVPDVQDPVYLGRESYLPQGGEREGWGEAGGW